MATASEVLKILIEADVKDAQKAIASFNQTIDKTKPALDKLRPAVANSSTALTNFGRATQDAPVGLTGIANNIDPLLDSLKKLSQGSGGAVGALKAFGAGLLGPAGIAIAVSAVTAAFIKFGPEIQAFFSSFGEAKQKAIDLSESTEALAKATANFGNAAREGAAKELTSLNAIRLGIDNQNLSQKERLFYVDELQKQYPAYFGNLSKEAILAGETGRAYSQLTSDILAAAKARAANDVLTKISTKKLGIEEQQLNNIKDAAGKANKARTFTQLNAAGSGLGVGGSEITVTRESQLLKIRNALIEANGKLTAETIKLNDQEKFYTDKVTEAAGATARLGEAVKKIPPVKLDATVKKIPPVKLDDDALKAFNAAQLEINKSQEASRGINQKDLDLINAKYKGVTNLLDAVKQVRAAEEAAALAKQQNQLLDDARKLKTSGSTAGAGILTAKPVTLATDTAKENIAAIQQSVTDITTGFNNFVTPAINAAFGALANGQSVFDALKTAVKGLIVQLISAVAQAAILSVILNAFSLGGASAAGGFSGILKGLLGIGKKASGGPVRAGTPYLVGENGPEIFMPNGRGKVIPNYALASGAGGGGTLSARVSGSDLLFVLNQAKKNNSNIFG